jgi:nucleoside-diphosphate-sugar epimerase
MMERGKAIVFGGTGFLGRRVVQCLLEITDFWIIKALDNCLSARSCGVSLHEDTILIPAGERLASCLWHP